MRIAFTHNLQRTSSEDEAEFDTPATVSAIAEALGRLGHEVSLVEASGPVTSLVARLAQADPDLVFNTAEGSRGRTREAFYPALFEQLGLPYTASDAFVCTTTLDKHVSKLIVGRRGVPTPRWRFVERVEDLQGVELTLPVIVKPNFEGSSKGITEDSVVRSAAAVRERVEEALARFPDGVLVEEFVEGVDVVVPFLEAASPETGGVLPAASYRIAGEGDGPPAIYDFRLKHIDSSRVSVVAPAPLPEAVSRELRRLSRVAFRALGVRDLGRIDWRVKPDGSLWFLEVNALPSLEEGAGIYVSAAQVGLGTMDAVLDAVVRSAAARHGLVDRPSRPRAAAKARVGLIFNVKRDKVSEDHDDEAEFDAPTTIEALSEAIASWGHEVIPIEARTGFLRAIGEAELDLAFNVAEGLRGRSREAVVPAVLDLLGIEYTGSDATTLALTLDKALAKRLVREAGVPTPRFLVMTRGDEPLPEGLPFPVVVKPNAEGSSKGVTSASFARDEAELRRLAGEMAARYTGGALVEEYLPGREFTVGILGEHASPRVLPPMEIVHLVPGDDPKLYTFAHKQAFGDEIRYDVPAKVDADLLREIETVAREAWWALGCRDVARIDVRQDVAGRVCFIEANPLPGLTPGWSDLCLIAEAAGIAYRDLIHRIMTPALARWRASRDGGAAGRRHG